MKHIPGILRRETGVMTRAGGPLKDMLCAAMATRKHESMASVTRDQYSRLTARQKGFVDTALLDYATRHKCSVTDLEWAMDRRGVTHVRKRPAPILVGDRT